MSLSSSSPNDRGRSDRWAVRARRFLKRDVWTIDHASLGWLRAWFLRGLRVLVITGRGFVRDRVPLRAAALTYVTIFSLVPLVAFSFAIAKGLGADETLYRSVVVPALDSFLGEASTEAVAPERADQDVRRMVEEFFLFVRETKFASLGAFSLVFLFYSVVKLLGAVENSFNEVWGVKSSRSLARRITNYTAIVVLTPLVLVTGTTITTLLSEERLGGKFGADVDIGPFFAAVPFLTVGLGMAYLYIALTNTKVHVRAALLGGLVGGVLWQLAQLVVVELGVGLGRHNAIFGIFASLQFLLLLVYVNWNVLLLGGQLAFACQNEAVYTSIARTGEVDMGYRQALGLRVAARVTAAFLAGRPAPQAALLAAELGVAPRLVSQVVERLVERRILARGDEELEGGLLPASEPRDLRVQDVLAAFRLDSERVAPPVSVQVDERVDRILAALDREGRDSLHNHSLVDLARTALEQADERAAGTEEVGEGSAALP